MAEFHPPRSIGEGFWPRFAALPIRWRPDPPGIAFAGETGLSIMPLSAGGSLPERESGRRARHFHRPCRRLDGRGFLWYYGKKPVKFAKAERKRRSALSRFVRILPRNGADCLPGEKKGYTLSDIAKELGVNKATVSKAISGKGNLSAETRARILDFTQKCGYKPNAVAQSLARSRSFNIGLMMPNPAWQGNGSFFHNCLSGVCSTASENGYDVLLILGEESSTADLSRLIDNRKIDGVIAMRSLVESPIVSFLKEKQLPFVLIGPTSDRNVVSVDNDNQAASREITAGLIAGGAKRLVLLGGSENHCVTHSRLRGFQEACRQAGLPEQQVLLNLGGRDEPARALPWDALTTADGVVCMDEYICNLLMVQLRVRGVRVPEDLQVVSLYDSPLLENNIPPVTSLHFDAWELGRIAGEKLLSRLDARPEHPLPPPGYQVLYRASTK